MATRCQPYAATSSTTPRLMTLSGDVVRARYGYAVSLPSALAVELPESTTPEKPTAAR